MNLCPCSSSLPYADCCEPFHQGTPAPDALKLMRSRFAAYALNLPAYIIQTTHPGSPQYGADVKQWEEQISEFSKHTTFERLEVLDVQERGVLATVTFVAHLTQGGQNVTFTEKSVFQKVKGRWLYRSGLLEEGHQPNLITTGQLRLLPLAYYGDPILRKVGDRVEKITPELLKLIEEMVETMDAADGIGLAAPQVHHSIQLFVTRAPIEGEKGSMHRGEVKVFLNPRLISASSATWTIAEGCLSIPTVHGPVERPKNIVLEYTNLEGKRVEERFSGWQARVILHEMDHVQGVLFIDHLKRAEREKVEPLLKHLEARLTEGWEL